jgi:hypothetical protein
MGAPCLRLRQRRRTGRTRPLRLLIRGSGARVGLGALIVQSEVTLAPALGDSECRLHQPASREDPCLGPLAEARSPAERGPGSGDPRREGNRRSSSHAGRAVSHRDRKRVGRRLSDIHGGTRAGVGWALDRRGAAVAGDARLRCFTGGGNGAGKALALRVLGRLPQCAEQGWPDFVFAFHDADVIGPRMLERIARHTGLAPEDL